MKEDNLKDFVDTEVPLGLRLTGVRLFEIPMTPDRIKKALAGSRRS